YLDKEEAQRQVAGMVAQRELKRQERTRLTQQAQTVRAEWRKHQEKMHQRELDATNLRHQRDTLVQRLQEDYQLDLAELHRQGQAFSPGPENGVDVEAPDPRSSGPGLNESVLTAANSLNAEDAQREIEELRRKLNRLGSVNLDALEELRELETRAT